MSTRYARLGGAHIAYRCHGQGPREVILLLGLSTHVEAAWDEPGLVRYLDRLASFARVTLMDFRGAGLSDALEGAVTLEALADDVVAVAEAANIGSAVVIACNETSLIAIPLAAAHPDLVDGLVVINGTARACYADDYPFGASLPEGDRYRQDIDDYADRPIALKLSAPSKVHDIAFVAWATRYQRLAASPGTLANITSLVQAADVRGVLPIVQCRTLVLHRTDDRFLPLAHGRYLAERVTGAGFVELDGADHLVWVGPGVDRQLDEIERFVTGDVAPTSAERLLATVLFTDIVRSTEQLTTIGDRAWTERIRTHDDICRSAVAANRGTIVKTTGDGILAVFDGPSRALSAALRLQADLAQLGMDVRAGVHTGEIELDGGDVRGVAVHTAARVMAVAHGGQLVASRTVRDLTAGSGYVFEPVGSMQLKGLPEATDLFLVASR